MTLVRQCLVPPSGQGPRKGLVSAAVTTGVSHPSLPAAALWTPQVWCARTEHTGSHSSAAPSLVSCDNGRVLWLPLRPPEPGDSGACSVCSCSP